MVNKSLYPLLYLSFSIFRFFTCHYGGKYCTFTPLHLFTFSIQSHAASEPKKHILKCIYFYKQSKEHNGKKKGKKYSDNQKIAEYNMVISTINNQTQILFIYSSLCCGDVEVHCWPVTEAESPTSGGPTYRDVFTVTQSKCILIDSLHIVFYKVISVLKWTVGN